jgi:hypothetical protein
MSRWKPCRVLALFAILFLGSAHSQTPGAVPDKPPAVTGSVTGSVYDEETRLPLRFAEINLVPIPSKPDETPTSSQPAVGNAQQQRKRSVQRVEGTSDIDGNFRLAVPEGDYLVAALKPGYITPGAAAAMDFSLSEDQLKNLTASLSQVHVGAGGTANVSLPLHRGAVITGRMQFADGSPAIGVPVGCEAIDSYERLESAMRPENRGKVASPLLEALRSLASQRRSSQNPTTDDQGRYRIFGLSPGQCVVSTIFMDHGPGRVVMNDGSTPSSGHLQHMYPEVLGVYAPAAFRRKDAKVFDIRGDEQITDADLTIDPNGMHTLRGKVLAADDHRAPQATVRLKEEGGKEAPRLVELQDDGTFQISYLPSGRYTVLITAFGVPDSANPGVMPAEYKTVERSIVVVDHDVLLEDVLMVPLKPEEHNDFSLLF